MYFSFLASEVRYTAPGGRLENLLTATLSLFSLRNLSRVLGWGGSSVSLR